MLQVCAFLAFAVKLVASRFCGRESNENRIKQLTGGDPLTARFMRQDLFTFMTTHKLFIVGNNQPKLIKVDDAARRRFQMIPFLLKIAQPDKQLRKTSPPRGQLESDQGRPSVANAPEHPRTQLASARH